METTTFLELPFLALEAKPHTCQYHKICEELSGVRVKLEPACCKNNKIQKIYVLQNLSPMLFREDVDPRVGDFVKEICFKCSSPGMGMGAGQILSYTANIDQQENRLPEFTFSKSKLAEAQVC